MKLKALLVILIIVIIAAVAWFVLMYPNFMSSFRASAPVNSTTAVTTTSSSTAPLPGFARGSIEELNNNGFTLTLASGATRNIVTTATTTIYNYATASSSPTTQNINTLSVGEPVLVLGDSPSVTSILTANVIVTGTLPGKGQVRSTLTSSGIPLPASIASATPPLDR